MTGKGRKRERGAPNTGVTLPWCSDSGTINLDEICSGIFSYWQLVAGFCVLWLTCAIIWCWVTHHSGGQSKSSWPYRSRSAANGLRINKNFKLRVSTLPALTPTVATVSSEKHPRTEFPQSPILFWPCSVVKRTCQGFRPQVRNRM